jgi:hypothetical protein
MAISAKFRQNSIRSDPGGKNLTGNLRRIPSDNKPMD